MARPPESPGRFVLAFPNDRSQNWTGAAIRPPPEGVGPYGQQNPEKVDQIDDRSSIADKL
jgi:hypothetical protein